MANFGVTGGIGAGIMQGLQFMRQREGDARQEQALANQTELLGMQKQLHGEKMGELNRANEERMRTDTLGALSTNVESVYSDLPAYQRQQMVIDNGLKAGLFKPADLEAAKLKVDGLRKAAGPDAYDALMRGDILPVQSLLKSKGIDLQADAKTPGAYIIRSPGSDVPQTVTHAGLLQLDAMSGAYEREQSRAAAALGRRKTEAEIQEKIANANLKDRLPQLNLGAGARGASGKEEKGDSGFPFDTKDIKEVTPIDPATNQPDPQKLANIGANAESILRLNAPLQKSPRNALSIAAALEKGELKPEAIYDPATNTYFKGVKFGSGAVRIASESDIDPDQFHGNKPGTTSVRLAADKAWLPQYLGTFKDLKQRASLEAAIKADTPQGQADRNKIIEAYDKFQSSGVEVPLFLRQQYNALRTGDRLKVAPAEKKPAAAPQAQPAADMSASGKPSYNGFIEASERLEKVKADAEKMSPDRRDQYLENRVPELEALVKHHSQYLNYR